jgi:hypothetical protein
MDAKQKEQLARMRKARAKKDMSISIQVQESALYDHNPTARFLLLIIALGQRVNEDAYVPEDLPDKWKDDMLGWCDMAQWRLMLRSGLPTENQVYKYIKRFKDDGVLISRSWTDSNNSQHSMYKIVESVVKEHQRPSQKADVERPSRYKKKRKGNKGSFTKENQPKRPSPPPNGGIEDFDEYEGDMA